MKKLGVVQWFNNGEGYVFCPLDEKSYYLHYSAIKTRTDNYSLSKNDPVEFTLYTNLYMSQVDSVWLIQFNHSIANEHKINRLMNQLFDIGSECIFKIEDRYYGEEI